MCDGLVSRFLTPEPGDKAIMADLWSGDEASYIIAASHCLSAPQKELHVGD